jgi:uncharacterized protein YebE (UPF0316 family)
VNTVLEMLFTASLAATSVTLWTVRVAVTARGSKALGALLAATEAMLFIVAFSKLMGSFDSAYLIIAYGAGVAAGTLAGLTLDGKLNPQLSRVDIFDATGEAIEAIVRAGFPFTRSDGFGSEGKVSVASIVTPEGRVRELIDMVGAAGPDSFWTVAPVRRANEVRIPGGHRQVARRSFTARRHARQLKAADQPTVSPQRTHAAAQV